MISCLWPNICNRCLTVTYRCIFNPRHACAVKVTIHGLCVCLVSAIYIIITQHFNPKREDVNGFRKKYDHIKSCA